MARPRIRNAAADIFGPLLFSLIVLAGCFYIVASKIQHYPAWLVTSAPVALMLVYAAMLLSLRAFRLRLDHAADNLYYMGFLFTLTSLGVSLYQFRAEGPAEEIVQNFGVAIASTIAGIALRVLFSQMRQDPHDIEQTARLELSEAARRVRRELDAAVIDLANFRRASQQMLVDGLTDVRGGMAATATRMMEDFAGLTAKAAEPLEATSRVSSDTLAALAKSAEESVQASARRLAAETDHLAEGTRHISESLETTSRQLAAVQTPTQLIELKLEPVLRDLSAAVADLARRADIGAEREGAASAALAQAQKMQVEQSERLGELSAAIAALTRQIETTTGVPVKRRALRQKLVALWDRKAEPAK
ncbi:hypothetical protein [Labrys monachus]|uniref:ElaB/YqjD/DUF883 family membrane-anchored ribosome-binding protein n=1 Tax=Labrys monachus TaxID=217067 RepID=A0ABU0F8F4_9HYPH|nr:hypothetical protein [Labrys monachus]MDQ0390647.1 ElaB/YqjD/DUF883 family membrane-anchored ribosome-binding protein [Labrys monachus]